MKSCMGYILEVDLTTGEIKRTKVPDEVYYNVLSGKGLGVWYCLKNIPADADPLGPDNVLGVLSGALTGTGALLTGRWILVGKSPLTGGWGDANCGGTFSPAIKRCGVDGIFFKGISEKPVYLYMDNKTCELRDASAYWGLDAVEAEEKLIADNTKNKKPSVAVIGTAGEKKSLISGVCNSGGRIAARSGLGAVMGSKNLKALVLAGTKEIPCADKDAMKELSKALGAKIKAASIPELPIGRLIGFGGYAMGLAPYNFPLDGSMANMLLKTWGTPMNTPMGSTSGDAPVKNWAGSRVDIPNATKTFDPDILLKKEYQKYHCYSCALGCGGILDIRGNKYSKYEFTHKPEYETLNQLGNLLLNDDLDSILYMNELLNRAGLDSISVGGTIAYAIECFENGLIDESVTDGLKLTWGNTYAILTLCQKIIDREGFGDILADGTKKAVERLGPETEQFAINVGGQELPAHDPRNDTSVGLHYMLEPAPGKHTIAMDLMYNAMSLCDFCSWAPPVKVHHKNEDRQATEQNALVTKANTCYSQLMDGMGACLYLEMMGVHTSHPAEHINAASGWNRDGEDYMQVGERIQTMRQLFNVKHGINPTDFKLPKRVLGFPPLRAGALKGVQLPNTDEQKSLHWKAFGWDPATGAPLPETLDKLGINDLLKLEVS